MTTKLAFIGDTHGKIGGLLQRLDEFPDAHIFQLGDMGLGFPEVWLPNRNHRFGFIRGNHDDPKMCREHKNYLGDYGYISAFGLFYLGGAWSIDWAIRKARMNAGGCVQWWADEELSQPELDNAYEEYVRMKPEIMISHECPTKAGEVLLSDLIGSYFDAKKDCFRTRTAEALQRMFAAHQPKHWIFGHYHINKDFEINGTHFRCCAELSPFVLETN